MQVSHGRVGRAAVPGGVQVFYTEQMACLHLASLLCGYWNRAALNLIQPHFNNLSKNLVSKPCGVLALGWM